MKVNNNFSSPNFDPREKGINYIIIHYTEMNFQDALERLCDPEAKVSAHYLIKQDGEIYKLVDETNIAWHAGKSYWRGEEQLNQSSIGIELDNLGIHDFPDEQMTSCIELCHKLMKQYDIPRENIIGHSDIASDRKIDPGIFFNWRRMAKRGIGIWYDYQQIIGAENYAMHADNININDMQKKLAAIGYKIDITGEYDLQTNAVIRSFQSHFYPDLIKEKGISFYRNLDSKYGIDGVTLAILNLLS